MADELTVGPDAGSRTDVLARICADTRAEVARRQQTMGIEVLRQGIAAQADQPRGFGQVLKHATGAGRFALIAEIKKASPSGGLIRADFDPAELALAYRAGGAACLSVLTNAPYFQGSDRDLIVARKAVDLPVLRKDFILDPWQVYESRAIGADCILLIVAALDDDVLLQLSLLAAELDLDVLCEVHDEEEMERALALPVPLIGVNNRNLRSFDVTLDTTLALRAQVLPERLLVTESGILTKADVQKMRAAGVHAVLVGEAFMRAEDPGSELRRLFATP
ncbi:MAG: indole-3-glycerol phosphate synthase TrpC [Steroidobacteraceae bacterium]